MNLIKGSISVLQDTVCYLENLSAEQYSHSIEILSHSTIGQHTRHFLECYQCLLSQAPAKMINYCLRERNLQLETDPLYAIDFIGKIITGLADLNLDDKVVLYSSKKGSEAIDSTIKRELLYNIEHGIHHLALIKVGLKIVAPKLLLPENFGVAPSTVKYRELIAQS